MASFKQSHAIFMVMAVIMVAFSSMTLNSHAASLTRCTLDVAGPDAQPCEKSLAPTDTLVIDCTGGAFTPGVFGSPTDNICTVAMTGTTCPAGSSASFIATVVGVGVAKAAEVVTITAPAVLPTAVTVYAACSAAAKVMQIKLAFLTKASGALASNTFMCGAIIVMLLSTIFIFSQ